MESSHGCGSMWVSRMWGLYIGGERHGITHMRVVERHGADDMPNSNHNIFCLHLVARFLCKLGKPPFFLAQFGYGAKWYIINHRYFLI